MVGPPSSTNFVDGGKTPSQQKGSLPIFCKSQLDSQTFGMAGLTGLWTRYHLGGDLNWLISTKKKSTSRVFYSKVLESNSNPKLTYPTRASLSLTTRISYSLSS